MPTVSANMRINLAETLPLVQKNEDRIAEGLSTALAHGSDRTTDHNVSAAAIVRSIIDDAKSVVDRGQLSISAIGVSEALQSQATLAIVGDSIVPVLKDIIGSSISDKAVGSWSDMFWAARHAERARGGSVHHGQR